MKLAQLSSEEFIEELAAKKPVPGGGGAAALVGALGVALNSMAANYSKGKKNFSQFDNKYEKILLKAEKLRKELIELVQKDADNFEPLSRAYAMPSSTEEERQIKDEELQRCLKIACSAPIEILNLVYEGILLHEEIVDISSKTIISDVGVGIQFLKAALNSSYLNILININSMTDTDYVDNIKAKAESLLIEGSDRADKVYDKVLKILRSN